MKAPTLTVIILFIACASVLFSCAPSPEELAKRGGEFYRVGQYSSAISEYSEAIRLDPDFAKAYYNRGHAFIGAGQLDFAMSDYEKALVLNPMLPDPYGNLASHYFEKAVVQLENKGLAKAESDYRKALQLNPTLPDLFNNLGTYYYNRANEHIEEGRLIEAEKDFKHALRLLPSLPDPLGNLGTYYYNRAGRHLKDGKTPEALEDYGEALRLNPTLPDPYKNVAAYHHSKGMSYINEQEYVLARLNLQKAAQFDPGNSSYKAQLSEIESEIERRRKISTAESSAAKRGATNSASDRGLSVDRNTVVRAMEEVGFRFNPVSRYGNREVVYGESTVKTSGGSIATLELTGASSDIENAYFKVFDVNEAPQVSAAYMLTFIGTVLPNWRNGPQWLTNATKRAISGDEATTRIQNHGGYVFIDVENNGRTVSIEVSNREISNYADQILRSP